MALEIIPNAMPASSEVDIGLITTSLNHIIHVLAGGYARISGATQALMWTFVALDVALLGAMIVLGLDAWQSVFKKTLAISAWLYFIQDFEKHANAIVNSLVQLGLMLGGQEGTDWRLVLDPSRILSKGFSLTKVLLDNLPPWYQMGVTDWLGAGLAFVLILLAFFIIAANAYILVIGFYLSLGVCGALLPFGLLPWTRSFAMKGIAAVVAHGVHLMLVAVATALAESVVQNLKFSGVPTLHETWSMVFVVGTVAALAWLVPQRFAQGIMGGASLGASDALSLASTAGGVAVGVASAGAGAAVAGGGQAVASASTAGASPAGGRFSQSIQPLQGATPSGGGSSAPGAPGRASAAPQPEAAAPKAPSPSPGAGDPILQPRRENV